MSLIALLQIGCLLAFALLLLLAAWQDLRTMRIADSLSLAIVAVFAAWALSGVALGTLSWSGVGLAVVCAVGLFGPGAPPLAPRPFRRGDLRLLAPSRLFARPAPIA